MKDGATSKVVILNRSQVMDAKAKSDSASGKGADYSPWNTNEEAMWLKTAARRLAKWVPTSAEYMREQLRAQAEVARELPAGQFAPPLPQPSVDLPDEEGDADDEGPIEAEFVDDEPRAAWPAAAQPPA